MLAAPRSWSPDVQIDHPLLKTPEPEDEDTPYVGAANKWAAHALPGKRSVEQNSQPSPRPHDKALSAALLIEAGEIENRLRKHVLTLLEPTIKKHTARDSEVMKIRAIVEQHRESLENFEHLLAGASTLKDMVEELRAELAEWDSQRRQHEQILGDRVSVQESALVGLRQSFEKRASDAIANNRAIKGLSETFIRAQQETHELRKHCTDRLDMNRDKISKLRDELETRLHALQNQQHKLHDLQTSQSNTITQVNNEINAIRADVAQAVKGVKDLWRSKASVTCVEEQQQEFAEFAQQLNAHVSGLRYQFGGLVEDVKQHFQTAADVVGTSTAKQMDAMRVQYGLDTARVDKKMIDMDNLVAEQRKVEAKMNNEISDVRQHSEREMGTFQGKIHAQMKKSEIDNRLMNMELLELKKIVHNLHDAEQGRVDGSFSKSEAMSMLVESEFLSALLDLQDDEDRRAISVYGLRPAEGRQQLEGGLATSGSTSAGKAWALPELPRGSSAAGSKRSASASGAQTARAGSIKSSGGEVASRKRASSTNTETNNTLGRPPVVTLDKRCLSCSNSSATVLAGFKMACLHYAASPIAYDDKLHSRLELIRLRFDLLNQIKEQLASTG